MAEVQFDHTPPKREILTATVLILALITISITTAAALSCDCGDICVNETGWWRDCGSFNASTTPMQAAADNANAGETICVAAGSYSENVNTATSHLTLAGAGAGVVTVNAKLSSDHIFNLLCHIADRSTADGGMTQNRPENRTNINRSNE